MCISDTVVRTNFLERFHKTLLSLEFCGNDYMKLRNGIGSLESLHDVYLDALSRCGGGLEQNMIARLEFLKWFRKEMERTLMPEPPRPLPGLFVSRDLYLEGVKDKYALHLRWLEETFNDYALKKLPRESADRVRCQIEGEAQPTCTSPPDAQERVPPVRGRSDATRRGRRGYIARRADVSPSRAEPTWGGIARRLNGQR
ncbi:MAG: hypothetical protein ACI4SY_06510, partial [Sutterella sp.]